jgi:hypothetical protein
MSLKGYRLWAMGQLDSNVQSPTSYSTHEETAKTFGRNAAPSNML